MSPARWAVIAAALGSSGWVVQPVRGYTPPQVCSGQLPISRIPGMELAG